MRLSGCPYLFSIWSYRRKNWPLVTLVEIIRIKSHLRHDWPGIWQSLNDSNDIGMTKIWSCRHNTLWTTAEKRTRIIEVSVKNPKREIDQSKPIKVSMRSAVFTRVIPENRRGWYRPCAHVHWLRLTFASSGGGGDDPLYFPKRSGKTASFRTMVMDVKRISFLNLWGLTQFWVRSLRNGVILEDLHRALIVLRNVLSLRLYWHFSTSCQSSQDTHISGHSR